jgi:hypothetical protein
MLELPFDTGLPDNFIVHRKDDPTAPVEAGWETFQLGDFIGMDPEPPSKQMRSTTLMFRRATIPGHDPLAAINSAWPAVLRNSYLAHPRWKRAYFGSPLHRWRMRLSHAPPVTRTVVQAARIAFPPASEADAVQGKWRGEQITTALEVLNEYLTALAPMTNNLAIGPIAAPELPPVLWGYRLRLPDCLEQPSELHEHFALVLHELLPWGTAPLTRQQADRALQISGAQNAFFMPAMTWMRNAHRSLLRENHSYAVLESATAIELAMSDVIRNCAPLAGYDATKVTNVAEGNFASRVKDHVAVLLSFDRDPLNGQDELGEWWRKGYLCRNEVVHRGHQPQSSEAAAAVGAAQTFLDEVIDRVYSDARFSVLLPGSGPSAT